MNKLQIWSENISIITTFIFKVVIFGTSVLTLGFLLFVISILMLADTSVEVNINAEPTIEQVTPSLDETPPPKNNLM